MAILPGNRMTAGEIEMDRAAAPQMPEPSIPDLPSGMQGVGRGVADVVFGGADLTNMALNVPLAGADWLAGKFGGEVPFRMNPNVSQGFADLASSGFESTSEALGYPINVRDESEMGLLDQGIYNAGRFGTAAAIPSAGLAMTAGRTAPGAASRMPTVADAFQQPYRGQSPGRVVAGDAATGAGAGVGFTGTQQIPEDIREMAGGGVGLGADLLGMLMGGMGGQALSSTVTGGPMAIAQNIRGRMPDGGVTRDPNTGMPVSRKTANEAARIIQENATDPRLASENIAQRSAAARDAGEPVPTAGLISGDTGLEALERGQRVRQGATTVAGGARDPAVRRDYSFTERDNRLREAASDRVQSLRDPNADPEAARHLAEGEADSLRMTAQSDNARAESLVERARQAEQDVGTSVYPLRDKDAQVDASQRLDRVLVDEGYIPARAEKNERFRAAIEPIARNEVDASAPIQAAERVLGRVNRLAGAERDSFSSELLENLAALSPASDGSGLARVGDLAGVRGGLKQAHETAVRQGNTKLADDIQELRGAVNRTLEGIDELAEANRFYREEFASVYRPDTGDTMARFTRDLDRSPNIRDDAGNVTGIARGPDTAASGTAKKFTATPESRESLKRVLDSNPSQSAAGMRAVDDFMTSKFAMQAVTDDGSVHLGRASKFMRDNADALNDFPQTKARLQGLVDEASRTGATSAKAKEALRTAQQRVKATDTEINNGAIGALLGREPREAAARILGGEDATRRMREVADLVKDDPAAAAGWKAAVSDTLIDRVTRDIDRTELSYAQIRKVWRENETTLAEVFSPEEMQALQASQRIMEPLLKREGARATVGSGTAENSFVNEDVWRRMRTILYTAPGTKYQGNALAVGGLVGRMRDMAMEFVGVKAQSEAVQRLLVRWNFDPETAVSLTGRDLGEVGSPKYNEALNKALRRAFAVREFQDDGESRGLEMTVTPRRDQ